MDHAGLKHRSSRLAPATHWQNERTSRPPSTRSRSRARRHRSGSRAKQFAVTFLLTIWSAIANGPFTLSGASAALQYKVGTFSTSTTTGAQSIATVGFEPKAVIFYWTRQTTAGLASHVRAGYGFASGPSAQRAIAMSADDALVFSNDIGQWQTTDSCILILNDGAPVLGAEAQLQSFDAGGFTLNWLSTEGRMDLVHYIALGGTDLEQTVVGTLDKSGGATGLGNQSVTGLGFQPDFVMMLSTNIATIDGPATNSMPAIGFAAAPWARGTTAASAENIFAPDAESYQRPDRVFVELAPAGAEQTRFDFVSFDRDGFTVRREVNVNPTSPVFYLALQGGAYQVGSFIKPTTAAPPTQTQPITGVGFQPNGLILMNKNRPPLATPEFEGRISFGASDGTSQGLTWFHNAKAPGIETDANQRTRTDAVSVHATQSNSAYAEAGLVSFDVDGFTLDWIRNDTANDELVYVAFGADPTPQTFYRSIGTASDYTAGTITATDGSALVAGSGTLWRTNNRGKGDRIDIGGTDYTILVASETELLLTTPVSGNYSGSYTISRQYPTLQAWEDCISGVPATCSFFPVTSSDLVADNRSEVGVVYDDGSSYAGITFDGSTTDREHRISLIVADDNRHNGVAANGVVLDNAGGPSDAITVNDDFVSVSGLEITGIAGANGGIRFASIGTANESRVDDCLIHDIGGPAIHSTDTDSNLLLYDNIVYDVVDGIRIDVNPANARIFNNTVFNSTSSGAEPSGIMALGANAPYPTVTLRNNIAHSNANGDFGVSGLNDASSHNFAGDTSGVSHSPDGGGQDSVTLGALNFVSTTGGSENLHLQSGSVAIDAAASLEHIFTDDIDEQLRSGPWDVGADEFQSATYFRSIGTASDYTTGQVNVTVGSPFVTGTGGTTWEAANRGRGDRISFNGQDFTILSVESDTELTLTEPVPAGFTASPYNYTIARKFTTLQAWEDCIDATDTSPVGCHDVVTSSLVTDDRTEVGIAYDDGTTFARLTIDGAITDANHTITLTADPGNRHLGIAGQGVVLDNGAATNDGAEIMDDFVTVEWLEITGGSGVGAHGIGIATQSVSNQVIVRNNLVHDVGSEGILMANADLVIDVYNNIVYQTGDDGIQVNGSLNAGAQIRLMNNTVYNNPLRGFHGDAVDHSAVTLQNNIAHSNSSGDFTLPLPINAASSNNLSGDGSATSWSPNGGDRANVALGDVQFVNTAGPIDLHIVGGSLLGAEDGGADLSAIFNSDIDAGARTVVWEIGADDVEATTAVELIAFEANGVDRAVELAWETGSEIDNLGFHLYRATNVEGPYARITTNAIPGLGTSPAGAGYEYLDSGLTNGVTYFYKLEDIETTGTTKLHGPVSATPESRPSESDDDAAPGANDLPVARITYGDPSANSLRLLERTRRHVVLELVTEGFYAETQDDGTVQLVVPGMESLSESGGPEIPVKRTWVDALAGRKVELATVRERRIEAFAGLRPSMAELPDVVATHEGTVRAGRRRARRSFPGDTFSPPHAARLVSVAFQGEDKRALVELAPLRWDETGGQLLLAKHLTVRLSFRGREPSELATDGRRGRRYRRRRSHERRNIVAHLRTHERGVHGVRYEDVMPERRGVSTDTLRLSRRGEVVAYHLEPPSSRFEPGSVLYFVSEGASANEFGTEAVYQLEVGPEGEAMERVAAEPSGEVSSSYWHRQEWEENRIYQPALVDAPDLWLWDVLFAPETKTFPIEVRDLAPSGESSRLSLWLQGVSDFPVHPDHHVRVFVNGTLVEELSWDGKRARRLDIELVPGLLRDGGNVLELENVGDTEASYSMVMLDRYVVEYPRIARADDGRLWGRWASSGTAAIAGLTPGTHVIDTSGPRPKWLVQTELGTDGVLRFRTEAGHRYLVASPEVVYRPEVAKPRTSRLKDTRQRADYLIIGPEKFLAAAEPLIELRKREGLRVRTVAIERIYSEFGFGEPTPEAVKDFLAYAYHHWRKPSPRYVLLLGDGTFDFKDYLKTGVSNHVPPRITKTSYLWTASDPSYAAVNGKDLLPDLAIGRLPAATIDEVSAIVEKIVAYETASEPSSGASTVLVADDPDGAGDFEADANALAAGVLGSRQPEKIFLSQLGSAATRAAILQSFDEGASLVSYLGHGGIHLWADENVFNTGDVASLQPQSRQPLVLTMNCLNGYFHFPYFDSLAEELVEAEDRGAIAAFAPSGLSLNRPAHLYHQALLEELVNGEHERLGDAILDAQRAYTDTGALPELISIYHLIGDPALKLR